MIEFALVLPVLSLLIFGSIDFARAYILSETANNAAREAAFYAAVHPGQIHNSTGTACADPSNADWHGTQEEGGTSTFTFTYSPNLTTCNPSPMPADLQPGQPLRVTAHSSLTLLTPMLGSLIGNAVNVSASVCVDVDGPPAAIAC